MPSKIAWDGIADFLTRPLNRSIMTDPELFPTDSDGPTLDQFLICIDFVRDDVVAGSLWPSGGRTTATASTTSPTGRGLTEVNSNQAVNVWIGSSSVRAAKSLVPISAA
jgi:hypothetical protein